MEIIDRVGRYFDILIYHDIFNRDYRIEGRNLSDGYIEIIVMLDDYRDIASHVYIAFIKS
jgi:hypothetical protein